MSSAHHYRLRPGCHTGRHILTKPGNYDNAFQQLKLQSGKQVRFLTGLALLDSASGKCEVDVVPTDVVFRELDNDEISSYLQQDEPYQCAGSFRSEGLGIALFDAVHNTDPSALIGLPLIRLCQMLRNHSYKIL
ncbi:MAG: Maf family protein [Porticoccaceae bacterium]